MSQISKTLLLLSSAFTVSVSAYSNVAPYPLTPRGLARREDFNSTVSDYIKEINTAIFAIGVIQDGQAIAECNPVYENAFTAMGFDGAYAEAFICNAAQGGTNFPGFTLDQARAGLMIALDGLILARDNPNTPARRLDCDNLDAAFLVDAELNVREIIDIICYPQNFTSTSTTLSGTGTMVTSFTSMPSATTTSGNLTTTSSSMSATITASNSTITGSTTAIDNSTTSTSSSSITSPNATTTSSTSSASGINSTTSTSADSITSLTSSSTLSITGTGTGTLGCLWQVATASGSILTCVTNNPTTFHSPTLGPTPYGGAFWA